MRIVLSLAAAATLALGFQAKPPAKAPAPKKAPVPTFKTVQPIFNENCLGCHNQARAKAGINFTSYATVMEGGEDGPIVAKGAPKHSLIIKAVRGLNGVRRMPPKHDPLTEDQIMLIENWIKNGAKQ